MTPSGSLLTITVKKNHLRRPFYPGRSPGIGQQNSWFKLCFSLSLSAQEPSLVGSRCSVGHAKGLTETFLVLAHATHLRATRLFGPVPEIHSHGLSELLFSLLANFSFPLVSWDVHIPLILCRHQRSLRELNSVFSFPNHRAPAILL